MDGNIGGKNSCHYDFNQCLGRERHILLFQFLDS